MTRVPANGAIPNASATEGDEKGYLEALRDCIIEMPGGAEDFPTYTIASGLITPAVATFKVDTEGAAAADDLTNIAVTNMYWGRIIVFRAVTPPARTVTVKNAAGGSGQIYLAGGADFPMVAWDIVLWLMSIGDAWFEIARSWGGNKAELRTWLGLGTAALLNVGTGANQIVQLNGSAQIPAVSGALLTGIKHRGQKIIIWDRKADATHGETLTAGVWNQRDLNYEALDEPAKASIASNQITLQAGVYYVRVTVPTIGTDGTKHRFRETTGTIPEILSQSQCVLTENVFGEILGKITVTASNVSLGQNIFEVQTFPEVAAPDGWGGRHDQVAAGYEFYTMVELDWVNE